MAGAFYTGEYRNVFREAGYKEQEIEQRLEEIFQTLFYGKEGERIYYPVGDDMGFLTDTGNHDVRTEGMSYGMMMCVQLNKKEEFDRIWKWTKTYMYLEEGENKGYFAWSCNLNGEKNAYGPAPDGEEYFAMALFFASNRWGDGEGIFQYSRQAREILHACVHKGEDGDGGLPMWEPDNKLIKFITNCNWSDPSYHLPHFYELFALWADQEDAAFWKEAACASREYLKTACHPKTGLAAEYADYDGSPHNSHYEEFGGRHDWYYSDAYRVAANIGLDYEWFGADEWERDCANRIQKFFSDTVEDGDYRIYEIDGTVLNEKALHPVAIIATNAQASLAADGSYAREHVKRFWETPLRQGERRYYDNCLYLFAFLALSGHYRIWKKEAVNPYLPSWEYTPDVEPYVFGERVYTYGSHDRYNGHVFCLEDYVAWSASIYDLGNWRYEGVIYPKTEDPMNREGKMCLYAPDVTVGPDGRYYLYYVLDHVSVVSVAVCDTPAGRYQFYGYVHYPDGTRLGEREGDEPQFDPAVLTEGKNVWLYTGFCGIGDRSRTGAMVTSLEEDMLTVKEVPRFIVPGSTQSSGTEYEGHAFFEASSIRKRQDVYYFIYSSEVMHELCYAVSDRPDGGFRYGGVIVSNCDLHIDSYKPADKPMAYGANNHGSIVEIAGKWYIFYHRHTNGTWYSRQGCAEAISFEEDGRILQAEMTSGGLNQGPLWGEGEHPAYLACNLFTSTPSVYVGDDRFPKIVQEGRDGDEEPGYIANIRNTATAGFKYFLCKDIHRISITARGYADGIFEIRTKWDGEALVTIKVEYSNVWEEYSAPIELTDGVYAFYITYVGEGNASIKSFALSR